MELARSSFYYKTGEPDSAAVRADMDIRDRIEALCLDFHGYGYRRVTRQLKYDGYPVNHKKVLRLMRESDLLCRARRKWTVTTDSSHRLPVYGNLVKGLPVTGIDQVWLADITYIRIARGFVYLAAILDAFSRKVIGYAISDSLDGAITLEALKMGIASRHPGHGVIHHSDRGTQYAALEYTGTLKEHGFKISMSGKGNPYDNATMESFFKTLKQEEVYISDYKTLEDVKTNLPHFIERVYNLKRLHSSLGYRSPVWFEEQIQLKKEEPRQAVLTCCVQP